MSSTASIQDSRLASPANANRTNSNHNGVSSSFGRPCQHTGCSSIILTGGEYCMRHKKSDNPVRPATSATASQPHKTHEIDSKVQPKSAQSPKVNGHSVETFGEGNSGDAITVNTSRQPMQPANSKKQLSGKSIARKSAGVSRSTPRAGYSPEGTQTSGIKQLSYPSFPDFRPGKKLRLSPMNNDGTSEKDPQPGETKKAIGTPGEEFSLRPRQKTIAKASNPGHSNGGHIEANLPKTSMKEKRSPDRGSNLRSPSIRDDGQRDIAKSSGRSSTKLHDVRADKDKVIVESKGPPVDANSAENSIEIQAISDQASQRDNKEHAFCKDKHRTHKSVSFGQEQPYSSRGHRPPGFQRNSEPLQSKQPHTNDVRKSLSNIDHGTTHSEPASGAVVSANTTNGVNGIHTQARFAIRQISPSPKGRKRQVARKTPQVSPVLNGVSDSDTPLTKIMLKPRSSMALSSLSRSEAATSHPATQPSSQTAAAATTSEVPTVNGLGFPRRRVVNQIETHGQRVLSVEERRKLLIEKHDPEKLDSYIYGKANEPFRPGSELFNVPWYEQPPRPVRPATMFGHFDPRVHWSQPKPEQWYRNKQDEIAKRGGRKAKFGKAATSVAQRKLEDRQVNRRVSLPDRVANNPQWLAALDELDEMEAANRLRLRELAFKAGGHRKQRQPQPQQEPQQPREHGEDEHMDIDMNMDIDNDEVEYESPSKAKRRRRGRKKGKARATIMDTDEEDYDGGDDEYMGVVSDLQ